MSRDDMVDVFCAQCGNAFKQGRRATGVVCRECRYEGTISYMPTQEQIAAECAEIRKTWQPGDYTARSF